MAEIFDDQILSDVLDGTADPAVVAAVGADPVASARLAAMRQAVGIVAEPPAPASAERRASSIAAALAAAEPAAPEVSSLTVARERKRRREGFWSNRGQVIAAAAAVVVAVLALPFLLSGGDDADVALDTAATAEAADEATDDAGNSFGAGDDDSADFDTAEESALAESADAMAGDAAAADVEALPADDGADRATDADGAETTSDDTAGAVLFSASNLADLERVLELGSVEPLAIDDPFVVEMVPAECLDTVAAEPESLYGVAELAEPGAESILVLVQFLPDGTTEFFDTRDCTPIR